jgi:hypothetical protein
MRMIRIIQEGCRLSMANENYYRSFGFFSLIYDLNHVLAIKRVNCLSNF